MGSVDQVWLLLAMAALITTMVQNVNDRQKIQKILSDLVDQRARHGLKERSIALSFKRMHDCVAEAKVDIHDYKVTLWYTLKNDPRGIVYTTPLTIDTDLKKIIKCNCLIS